MYRAIADLLLSDTRRIEHHLLSLSVEDRSLRFAAGVVTDATIKAYVSSIRFRHDLVLGLISQRGVVFGLAHGCVFEQAGQLHIEAAFSVDAPWRGVGLGQALMAAVQCRAGTMDRERTALVGMCAARNWPMRRIFERAGLELRHDEDEIHARGWVPGRELTRSRLPMSTWSIDGPVGG